MNHITEEDLIAYQLEEAVDSAAIRNHLEVCTECASAADSIAETLRVFSAEPVPQANLEHAWQRLRGNMPVLAAPPSSRMQIWKWLMAPLLAAALLVVFVATRHHRGGQDRDTAANGNVIQLRAQPRDQGLEGHLDSAERLLTEVSHSTGPLDETTRHQAQGLLLSNALYVRKANESGDLAEAAVLDKLDRTLTTLHHADHADNGWHLRLAMDANGLLLDIRILQQNDITPKESQ